MFHHNLQWVGERTRRPSDLAALPGPLVVIESRDEMEVLNRLGSIRSQKRARVWGLSERGWDAPPERILLLHCQESVTVFLHRKAGIAQSIRHFPGYVAPAADVVG